LRGAGQAGVVHRVGHGRPGPDVGGDGRLPDDDRLGPLEHLLGVGPGDEHHPGVVRDDQVAVGHLDTDDRHRHPDRLLPQPAACGARPRAAGEHREAVLLGLGDVTADTVGHDAGDAAGDAAEGEQPGAPPGDRHRPRPPARHPAGLRSGPPAPRAVRPRRPASWTTGIDEPTDLASTAELPWIWLSRSISPDYHDQVVACCRAAGFAPDARHTARSITSQLAMVACGLGVALVPESATHGSRDTGGEGVRFLRIENSADIDLAAVWRREASPLVDRFIMRAEAAIHGGDAAQP
jgi:hypothetical protein